MKFGFFYRWALYSGFYLLFTSLNFVAENTWFGNLIHGFYKFPFFFLWKFSPETLTDLKAQIGFAILGIGFNCFFWGFVIASINIFYLRFFRRTN